MIELRRLPLHIRPDSSRVLVRPFIPEDTSRILKILARILALSDDEVVRNLEEVLQEFEQRHHEIREIFIGHFERIKELLPTDRPISHERRLLIGAYFTSEYSLESAALFNPSIVPHPDQSDIADGAVRIILSLRATGEGHISSITFRSGLVLGDGRVEIDTPTRFVTEPKPVHSTSFERDLFHRKLIEIGVDNDFSRSVMGALDSHFDLNKLKAAVATQRRYGTLPDSTAIGERMIMLARSNYESEFDPGQSISERIIFPFSPSQSNGIEDARFVRFQENDGSLSYVATYTAYDGRVILPQLLETKDFLRFSVCTLNGPGVRNKGMALFPRRVNNHYCMLSRQDNENIHIMFSDHLHFWFDSKVIVRPMEAWECVQLGNCGSPIETEAGWLVLTHGVGPMRRYCIGAVLLDLNDPTKLIGRLHEPLIKPGPEEREGYVPNVVYTCGAMVHRGQLIIPYAVSDSASTFATVPLADVLNAMHP